MKRIIVIAAVFLGMNSGLIYGDVPPTINYQGRLTDRNGTTMLDADYTMTFRIFDDPTSGSELYAGVYTVHTQQGYFGAVLGSGAYPFSLATMDFSKTYYLETYIGSEKMSPRQPLSSVPYALNVPDNSVTTNKLKDAAVTQAKAPWAPSVYSNGVALANPKIACGYSASTGPVTFPPGLFTQPPIVTFATSWCGNLGYARVNNIDTGSITKDGFTTYGMQSNGGGFTNYSYIAFYWIAVGQ